MVVEIDFSNIEATCKKLLKTTEKYSEVATLVASAKAQYEYVDEQTKSVLARAFLAADARTVGEKERLALDSQEYLGHLELAGQKRLEYLELKAKHDTIRCYYEAFKAILSAQQSLIKIQ